MRQVYKKREEERLRKEQQEMEMNYPFKPKTFNNEEKQRLDDL